MPSHLRLAHYGPGLIGYQTGACIVGQAQEQAGPEYIRPGTASSEPEVTPAASMSTYDVRWDKPDMGAEACFYKGLHLGRGGNGPLSVRVGRAEFRDDRILRSAPATALRPCPPTQTPAPSTRS